MIQHPRFRMILALTTCLVLRTVAFAEPLTPGSLTIIGYLAGVETIKSNKLTYFNLSSHRVTARGSAANQVKLVPSGATTAAVMEKHMLQTAGKTPLKVTGHFYNQIDGFQIVVTSIEPAAAPPLIPVSLLEVDSDRQRPRDNPSKDETDAQRYGSKITFANTSRVVGERDGNRLYEWRIYSNANVFPRNTVKEVQYTLHSSFSPRTVTVKPDAGDPDKVGYVPDFSLTRRGWGEFTIGILVSFPDGSTHRTTHELRLRDDNRGE